MDTATDGSLNACEYEALVLGGALPAGPVAEREGVSPAQGPFLAEQASAVVRGDVLPGGHVAADRTVVVTGQVRGSARQKARILAGEGVVLAGAACHAQVAAAAIEIRENADRCRLSALSRVHVAGDLCGCSTTIGDATQQVTRRDELTAMILPIEEQEDALQKQLKVLCRRTLKLASTTGLTYDLNLGSILGISDGVLAIDLEPVYRSLRNQDGRKRDEATRLFFDHVVVGALTKANSVYVSRNTARQRVFLRVLHSLRELFSACRDRDRQTERLEAARAQLDALDNVLRSPAEPALTVAGFLRGTNEIQLALRHVAAAPGAASPAGHAASIKVIGRDGGQACQVRVEDRAGCRQWECSQEELRGVRIGLTAGGVTWAKLSD